jgi:allantoate deiminase
MVATVGHISVCPSAHTMIPGAARLSLDLRHEDDLVREHALLSLRDRAEAIAAARGVATRWHVRQESLAVPADPKLTALLAQAIAELGYSVERLPSGAGHDAAAVVEIAPIAMLFVRCRVGISYNHAEPVEPEDVAAAIEATSRFLDLLAEAPWR